MQPYFKGRIKKQFVMVCATLRSEFAYDGLGRRAQIVEKSNGTVTGTSKFVWCGKQLCEERDSTGTNVSKRFFAEGEQIGGANYFFTRDHLGSIREMMDTGRRSLGQG